MSTATVKLIQVTDPHLFADPVGRLRGVLTLNALQDTLRAAADDIRDAFAVLTTGDLVQDDPGGYARFREAMGGLGKPVLCIPGNHDEAPALRQALQGAPFQVGGQLAASELDALEAALAASPDRHALIALHHHPVTMHSHWLDTVGLTNAAEFFAVLDRHPQVRGIVFGHVHQAFEHVRRGVRILGTPSTCAQFLPRAHDFAVDNLPPAYRVLNLEPDGRLESQVAWLSQARRAAGGER